MHWVVSYHMQAVVRVEALEPLEDALRLVEAGVVRHAVHDDEAIAGAYVELTYSRVLLLTRRVENVQHTRLQRANENKNKEFYCHETHGVIRHKHSLQ